MTQPYFILHYRRNALTFHILFNNPITLPHHPKHNQPQQDPSIRPIFFPILGGQVCRKTQNHPYTIALSVPILVVLTIDWCRQRPNLAR